MLTRGDLIEALTRRGRAAIVGDHMKRECATADVSEMLEPVLGRLQGLGCHTVPITARGTLVGLVTLDNVGEFLMIQAAEQKRLAAVSRG
jgi:Mg/Co/Ni transporter MgtE